MQLSSMGIINIGGGGGVGQFPLDGMWLGSANGMAIGWVFSGNFYQMWVGASMIQSGTFALNGNTLSLTINETGGSEKLAAQFGADGNSLSLTDEGGVTVAFQRQQGGPQAPQPTPPQPVPPQPVPPQPAPSQPTQPQRPNLEGRWVTNHNGTQIIFVYQGDKYEIWAHNKMDDSGHFWFEEKEYNYHVWSNKEGKAMIARLQMSPDGNSFTLSDEGGSYLFQRMP
jgi:hypothetical protein